MVQAMIVFGANIESKNAENATARHVAASHEGNEFKFIVFTTNFILSSCLCFFFGVILITKDK